MNIYLDMDGVLCNWSKAACEVCGVDYNDPAIRAAIKASKHISDFSNLKNEIWERIAKRGIDFYANLEIHPWAHKLYDTLNKLGNLCLLTSPGNNVLYTEASAMAAAGKVLWVKKHFNTTNLLIGYSKHFCANQQSILVDDSVEKITQFRNNGGRVWVWPNDVAILDGEVDVNQEINRLARKIVLKGL